MFFFTRHWEICVKPKEWTFSLFTFQTKFLLIPQCAKFCLAAGFQWPGVTTVWMWYVIVCVHSRTQEYLLGWKYYTSKTFQNYQSTIKVWLSLRKIFQLTKSLKPRDLVWPLFSLLKFILDPAVETVLVAMEIPHTLLQISKSFIRKKTWKIACCSAWYSFQVKFTLWTQIRPSFPM